MAKKLNLPFTSRYLHTKLHQLRDDDGNLMNQYAWGSWEAIEFPESTGDVAHTVRRSDVGRLDLLAARYYGTRMSGLWWIIAHVNDIDDPFAIEPGDTIRIPSKTLVNAIILSRDADTGVSTPESP